MSNPVWKGYEPWPVCAICGCSRPLAEVQTAGTNLICKDSKVCGLLKASK